MSKDVFKSLVQQVTRSIKGMPLDGALESHLQKTTPAALFADIEKACQQGIAEGWMCAREHGGIKYGRVFEADPALDGFSVDVVRMENVVGPHHKHPEGEIDMVMPLTPAAKFDGAPRGWKVYGPNSAHKPTVTDGAAIVLYLLPAGKIEFTRS